MGDVAGRSWGFPLGKLALAFLRHVSIFTLHSPLTDHRTWPLLQCSGSVLLEALPDLSLPSCRAPLMHRESSGRFWPLSFLQFSLEDWMGSVATARSVCKPTAHCASPLAWDLEAELGHHPSRGFAQIHSAGMSSTSHSAVFPSLSTSDNVLRLGNLSPSHWLLETVPAAAASHRCFPPLPQSFISPSWHGLGGHA